MIEVYSFAILIGLCVGSFLNVVIYRLPKMIFTESDGQNQIENSVENKTHFNLFSPGSHCPHCRHAIPAKYNIPVIAYFWLKGHCAHCRHAISPRYLLIELLTAAVTVFAISYGGITWATLCALVFSYNLICLVCIDLEHQILPDLITIPLIWIGLLLSLTPYNITHINSTHLPTSSADAIIGAVVGYLSLWSFAKLFSLIRGKEGMGHGDFKLFAAFGAWLGWQLLPLIILIATFLGSIGGIITLYFNRQNHNVPIAFGPYLAIAGWIAFYWGHAINTFIYPL